MLVSSHAPRATPMTSNTISDKELRSDSYPNSIPYFARNGESTSTSSGSQRTMMDSAINGFIIQAKTAPHTRCVRLHQSYRASLRRCDVFKSYLPLVTALRCAEISTYLMASMTETATIIKPPIRPPMNGITASTVVPIAINRSTPRTPQIAWS